MSYEKKVRRSRPFESAEGHKESDGKERKGRRFPSSKSVSDGSERRKARKAFFTELHHSAEEGESGNAINSAYRKKGRKPYENKERRERKDYSGKKDFSGRKDYSGKKDFSRRKDYKEHTDRDGDAPRYIGDSPILDEIVRKRRAEGRASERKPKVLSLEWNEERGMIRLNKYIANAGVCSRREADKLIEAGAVTVNGVVVTELGTKILPTDEVRYGDQVLQREKPVYILLNKPKDYITTTSDEFNRKNVMNLLTGACEQRVYPVGRLDRNTTGLLLITNDGELAKKLTHPRYGVKKIYHVELDRNLSGEDFSKIITGLELNDGFIAPDELAYVGDTKREIGITLHSGKNRIVRRIFEHLGYDVIKLDRVYYAGLTKKDLPRGHWRFLKPEEVNILKMSL